MVGNSGTIKQTEISVLSDLIDDFPVGKNLNVRKCWKKIRDRYRAINDIQIYDIIIKTLTELSSELQSPYYSRLSKLIHKILFKDILSNAGDYRQSIDPNIGYIGFGGFNHRRRGTKFRGTNPEDIASEVIIACSYLTDNSHDPVWNSIRFYQKFVHVHPFYDANGRIARFIVTFYLRYQGYYVKWRNLEEGKKDKFLKKLNKCHIREGKHGFNKYFKYLYDYWQDHVVLLSSLSPDKD